MRLIDADALRGALWKVYMSDRHAWTDYMALFDAAPTVSCDECEHWDDEGAEVVAGVRFAMCQNKPCRKEHNGIVRSAGWVCPGFERRQP